MSSVVKSLYESRWEEGYAQLFSYFIEIPTGQTVDFVLDIGLSKHFAIKAFIVECSGIEVLEWQSFVGTKYIGETGTIEEASPRNSITNKPSETKLVVNPTIISVGLPLVSPARDLLAQNFAGNRFYIRQSLLGAGFEEELLLLQKNLNYMVRITNNENPTARVNLIVTGWNQ